MRMSDDLVDPNMRMTGKSDFAEKRSRRVAGEGLQEIAKQNPQLARMAQKLQKDILKSRIHVLQEISQLKNRSDLSIDVKHALKTVDNALTKNLKPHDLIGALRDKLGIPVVKGWKRYDHLGEVEDVLKSIQKAIEEISKTSKQGLKRGARNHNLDSMKSLFVQLRDNVNLFLNLS